MKKIFALMLAAVMLLSLAACGAPKNPDYEGTLHDLVDAIYEKRPVEMMVSQAIDMNLEDPEDFTYYANYTGLSSADGIAEAVFSEPMIGAQAYSLVLIRPTEDADVNALKNELLNNVNMRKWVCVAADSLIVGNCGDVIIMVMADSQLGATLSEDIYNAFVELTGATGEKLTK